MILHDILAVHLYANELALYKVVHLPEEEEPQYFQYQLNGEPYMYIKIGSDEEELDSTAVSLQNGSLMWTETTDAGVKEVMQLRICTSTEFYDAER